MAHRSSPSPRRPGKDQGFSLVEVLMAASILCIGMLGIAAMQVVTLRGGTDSKTRQTAVAVGNGTLDLIHAEGRMVALDKYTFASTTVDPATIRNNLSGGTVFTQTYTTTVPPIPPGAGSVAYTAATWNLFFDANGAVVPAGDAAVYYQATIDRIEPTVYAVATTQSVNFRVQVAWTETGQAKTTTAKTLTLNRYVMY